MARAAGLNLREAFPLVHKGLRRVGIASATYGAVRAVIIVHEGGNLTKEEIVVLGAGAIVGVAVGFTTGWVAVTLGVVSLGIAIYEEVELN